jgi:putative component of toxin-antitoxin plasmid stabilization module
MGRSGTTSLWSSGITDAPSTPAGRPIRRVDRLRGNQILDCVRRSKNGKREHFLDFGQGYRVKPHEQLVMVSLTGYPASTPILSTSWSRTTLQGARGPGKTHLETSFPLRCFQRLSLPHIATRQCHWRDNRYTRGASTPVLSY